MDRWSFIQNKDMEARVWICTLYKIMHIFCMNFSALVGSVKFLSTVDLDQALIQAFKTCTSYPISLIAKVDSSFHVELVELFFAVDLTLPSIMVVETCRPLSHFSKSKIYFLGVGLIGRVNLHRRSPSFVDLSHWNLRGLPNLAYWEVYLTHAHVSLLSIVDIRQKLSELLI